MFVIKVNPKNDGERKLIHFKNFLHLFLVVDIPSLNLLVKFLILFIC